MRCEDLVQRISRSSDSPEGLPANREAAEHLSACPECRQRGQELRDAESILMTAPLVAPPDGFSQRVMMRVATERAWLASLQNSARPAPRVAVAASAVALSFTMASAVLISAILAWNLDALPSLTAHSLVLAVVDFLGMLASLDALVRAIAVIWRSLPVPAAAVALCTASFGAFLAASGWAWLVSRYGWASRSTSA